MRICATSDFHGRLPPDIDPCDLLLIVGDLCPHGRPVGSTDDKVFQRQWLISVFLPWVASQPCREWFVTAGNHDFVFESPPVRDLLPPALLDRLLLDRTAKVTVGTESLRIHGSPWSLPFRNWAFMATEDEMAARLDAVPQHVEVLMVHGPPFGIGDKTIDGVDAGSRQLRKIIAAKAPRLSLHGHIHEGSGHTESLIRDGHPTIIQNVAYLNERYQPANQPSYFVLPPMV